MNISKLWPVAAIVAGISTAAIAQSSHSSHSAMPDMSEAGKAYMDAMEKMDAPMMEALKTTDPDAAFVRGMIPHHQGAIDMAKAVLKYGKDPEVRRWAEQIIAAQEQEITEFRGWLAKRGG